MQKRRSDVTKPHNIAVITSMNCDKKGHIEKNQCNTHIDEDLTNSTFSERPTIETKVNNGSSMIYHRVHMSTIEKFEIDMVSNSSKSV